MRLIRQGDVLLVRLPGLPRGARLRPETIARIPGEDGHAHVLTGSQLYEFGGRPIAVVRNGKAVLDHDEHPAVSIGEGVWEIRTPRVFDWPTTEPAPAVETPAVETRSRSVPYED